jgi:hypothetical protein
MLGNPRQPRILDQVDQSVDEPFRGAPEKIITIGAFTDFKNRDIPVSSAASMPYPIFTDVIVSEPAMALSLKKLIPSFGLRRPSV